MEKLSDRWMYYCGLLAGMGVGVDDLKHIQDLIDAEEQGLLEIFICNTGDIVYYVCSILKKPTEFMIERIEVYEDEIIYVDAANNEWVKDDFGKIVFLTKEEAEQKLAEMKGE